MRYEPARWIAKDAGAIRYSTGKPCANGHLADRHTSTGKCVECHRLRRVRKYRANPEPDLKRKREYDAANRDVVNARARARDKTKKRESTKRWRASNIEQAREGYRAYYWGNPESERLRSTVKRARRRKAEGYFTKADLKRILILQRNCCAMCRIDLRKTIKHLDHITPLSKEGTNWPKNLQFLCQPCNLSKNAKDPLDFAREKGFLL